ncbi:hypothetical protein M3Y97_00807100 [Aphelenchoides bicaudatus]|nr:hypothetical protein M3Y97_00807100 [Aphelenchoides bicaudatus]
MDELEGGGTKMGSIIVDIINNLRLVEPEVTELSNSLQTESEKFVGGVTDLESQIIEIRQIFQDLGELADTEKMRAMNAVNELAASENYTATKEVLHLKASIQEKSNELEIAKQQLENLKHLEAKQLDFLRRLQSTV